MLKEWPAWPRSIRWLAWGIAVAVLALVVAWALFVPMADWLAHHDTDLTNADLAFAEDLSEATFTAANLAGVRWPEGEPVPEGWKLNAGTGRLQVG